MRIFFNFEYDTLSITRTKLALRHMDIPFCPETTKASTWSSTTSQNARITTPRQIPAITSVKLCMPKYTLASNFK
jgi:hypothetical protein